MEKKTYLGNYARKVLEYTLPFMIFFAFALTVYVAKLDAIDVMLQKENILLFLATLGRLSFCLALGAVLADIAERRTKKNA